MDSTTICIEERVSRLERQNRLLRWLLLCIPCIFLFMGAESEKAEKPDSAHKIVTAEKFVITDAKGTARASLAATEDGSELRLGDSNGKLRVRVAAFADVTKSPSPISLLNANEQIVLILGENPKNGIGYIEYWNKGKYKGGHGGSAFDNK